MDNFIEEARNYLVRFAAIFFVSRVWHIFELSSLVFWETFDFLDDHLLEIEEGLLHIMHAMDQSLFCVLEISVLVAWSAW